MDFDALRELSAWRAGWSALLFPPEELRKRSVENQSIDHSRRGPSDHFGRGSNLPLGCATPPFARLRLAVVRALMAPLISSLWVTVAAARVSIRNFPHASILGGLAPLRGSKHRIVLGHVN